MLRIMEPAACEAPLFALFFSRFFTLHMVCGTNFPGLGTVVPERYLELCDSVAVVRSCKLLPVTGPSSHNSGSANHDALDCAQRAEG